MKTRKYKAKVKRGKNAVELSVSVKAPALERKIHYFMNAWKEHIHDEIRIHKDLLSGKQGFDRHLNETIRIHKKFIDKIKKI